MKRIGNLYEKVYDIENLKLAHKNAKKGKGWYKEVKMVDSDPDYYLGLLQEMLINKTYHTSEYKTFIKHDTGKDREIYKLPYFPDRICQWAILQIIEPYLTNNLTINTYSAIPNRGIHFGLERVIHDIQTDVKGCQFCLKFDVKKYYPSINHGILKQKYRRIFKDSDLLWLLDEIIDSTETADPAYKIGKDLCAWEIDMIEEETGIPIGNYISQWSGNFYLSSFDHWIKEEKHIKHVHRYMDDVVIFGETKEELHKLRIEIDEYFRSELKLQIKDNWQVFPTYVRGVDFLGYRIFMNYVLLRKSTVKQMKKKMIRIREKVESGNTMNYLEWCSINSYNGWLKYCDSYRLKQKYIEPLKPYADFYYTTYVKGKGKKKHERSWNGQKCA